jgi:DNA-binding transcriptional MerR regulator
MAQGLLSQVDSNPQSALAATKMMLVSQLGPDKFAQAFGQIGGEERAQALAPYELKQKQAEATIKTEEANTAHQKFLNDLEAQGWNIKKIQEDINASREGTRLKAMQVAMEKELQPLKKQELQVKINEANQKLGDQMREKVASAQGAAASIDNLSNTVDRILKNPALDSVIGSIQGRLPSITSDQGADAIALIDQLGSQAFIAQIPQMKGTGSLSEKEGDKLQASLQNLSRTQSESQFKYNLQEVQRLMAKARENLSKKTGVPLSAPDRPNAPARAESAGPVTPGAPANQQRNVVVDF